MQLREKGQIEARDLNMTLHDLIFSLDLTLQRTIFNTQSFGVVLFSHAIKTFARGHITSMHTLHDVTKIRLGKPENSVAVRKKSVRDDDKSRYVLQVILYFRVNELVVYLYYG